MFKPHKLPRLFGWLYGSSDVWRETAPHDVIQIQTCLFTWPVSIQNFQLWLKTLYMIGGLFETIYLTSYIFKVRIAFLWTPKSLAVDKIVELNRSL